MFILSIIITFGSIAGISYFYKTQKANTLKSQGRNIKGQYTFKKKVVKKVYHVQPKKIVVAKRIIPIYAGSTKLGSFTL